MAWRLDEREVAREVETALGSLGCLKLLRELCRKPEEAFTKYRLGVLTDLNSKDVARSLSKLVKIGWVKAYPYEPKKFQINLDKEVVKNLNEFFHKCRYI